MPRGHDRTIPAKGPDAAVPHLWEACHLLPQLIDVLLKVGGWPATQRLVHLMQVHDGCAAGSCSSLLAPRFLEHCIPGAEFLQLGGMVLQPPAWWAMRHGSYTRGCICPMPQAVWARHVFKQNKLKQG